MLGSVETIDVLSDMIEKHNLTTVVVDPVRCLILLLRTG